MTRIRELDDLRRAESSARMDAQLAMMSGKNSAFAYSNSMMKSGFESRYEPNYDPLHSGSAADDFRRLHAAESSARMSQILSPEPHAYDDEMRRQGFHEVWEKKRQF